ncbi:MAG TPA: JAB domain-containing protein [Clostridiales bacterium]|nr:JAB domain-containing protein [Clostridiales bacterium]
MRITKYTTIINKESKLTELLKEKGLNYKTSNTSLTNPRDIVKMMNDVFQLNEMAEEYVYMIAFDTKNKPIGVFEVSHGTINTSILRPREVFLKALLVGAVNIALVHNHPSGDVTPSREDVHATKRIEESGKLIGIGLLDHIIIGDNYLSFREENYF